MFRLLAREVPAAELHEVRRFDAAWERQASVRLRDGDLAAVAAYDRHGRIRGADHETACDRAASMWLADYLRGKDVLLLAGSNAEAADLARRVQAKLTQLGTVGPPQTPLSDGNHAGFGDLVRARLNTEIDAGGRTLTNRDTLRITGVPRPQRRGPAAAPRRHLDRDIPGPQVLPRRHAELAYAGNVHVAQGRTVDTAHLLVTECLSRQALYVGMTRGRQANTAHVVTGTTAPSGHEPYQQAAPEAVLAGIMRRDDEDLSATEQIRQAQDRSGGTGHLLTLWSAAIRQTLHPDIDQQIKARLTEHEAWRYDREHARRVLHQRLRAAQLAGHDLGALIDPITAAPMDQARSVTSVLHYRLEQLALPDLRHGATWAQRTPATAPPLAHQLAAALDDRARTLGEHLAASPEPWLARHLGVLAPGASPALREEYTRRAGTAAAYREAAGITNPDMPSHPCRTAATLSSKPCARPPRRAGDPRRNRHPPWPGPRRARSRPSTVSAPAPPLLLTSARRYGSPPRPKPMPGTNRRRPHPARPHRRSQCHSSCRPPSRPTPAPRSRPRPLRAMVRRAPALSGTRPGKPQPNCNGEGKPSQMPGP